MNITPMNGIRGNERSRSGLKAAPTEKIEFRKTKEDSQEEFRYKLWQEVARRMGEDAVQAAKLEEVSSESDTPSFESEHQLDILV